MRTPIIPITQSSIPSPAIAGPETAAQAANWMIQIGTAALSISEKRRPSRSSSIGPRMPTVSAPSTPGFISSGLQRLRKA